MHCRYCSILIFHRSYSPEELPGISSIRDVEYDIEFASGAKPIAEAPYRISPVKWNYMDPEKLTVVTKFSKIDSETEAGIFWGLWSIITALLSKIARIFQQEIVQLHGTPSAIVSDKDPRFMFRILETHTRQEGYTNKLSRPLKLSAKLSCFLESIAYEWRQTFWYYRQDLFHQTIRNSRSRREISYRWRIFSSATHVHYDFNVFSSESQVSFLNDVSYHTSDS
ncbi:hypothetical protein Tco_0923396 [Tanacetum coccineum]|uniref:Integrase catalytic domain-containing protein n=1 Tax=Tanacetum coccineum TaxID=301880 RepID=A0ABQ5D2E4_9ASTR